MTGQLDATDKIHAKIASENLFRALAGYHMRRTDDDETRRFWKQRLGIKVKEPRKQRIPAKPMTLEDAQVDVVLAKATELTGISLDEIYSRDKKRERVRVRKAICFAISIRSPKLSLARIAEAVGRHDHTTACHALQTAARIYSRQAEFRTLVDALVAA